MEAVMTKTATITVRLDPQVKKNAEAVLKTLGLTTTQAVNLFFTQVSLNKGLPFAVEVPNAETLKAMEDVVLHRNVETFDSVEALFSDLES
jgi:DNA-damage-inducible protein J